MRPVAWSDGFGGLLMGNMMHYEAWRITYQDSEQAAKAAFAMASMVSSKADELLEALDSMARQHCGTDTTGMTSSGAITANADAMLLLEQYRRFRVTKDFGRMVCGHWPENDPNKTPNAKSEGADAALSRTLPID
jgi:hypothetical protein